MSDLTIELAPSASPRSAQERASLLQDPGFGQVFTDHMVSARYSPEHGWHDARLTAYQKLVVIGVDGADTEGFAEGLEKIGLTARPSNWR